MPANYRSVLNNATKKKKEKERKKKEIQLPLSYCEEICVCLCAHKIFKCTCICYSRRGKSREREWERERNVKEKEAGGVFPFSLSVLSLEFNWEQSIRDFSTTNLKCLPVGCTPIDSLLHWKFDCEENNKKIMRLYWINKYSNEVDFSIKFFLRWISFVGENICLSALNIEEKKRYLFCTERERETESWQTKYG